MQQQAPLDAWTKRVLCVVVVWSIGVWGSNRALDLGGGRYPMLDATTPNPRYSAELHNFIFGGFFVWTALCVVAGRMWVRALEHR
jgi:hypothetical protein